MFWNHIGGDNEQGMHVCEHDTMSDNDKDLGQFLLAILTTTSKLHTDEISGGSVHKHDIFSEMKRCVFFKKRLLDNRVG